MDHITLEYGLNSLQPNFWQAWMMQHQQPRSPSAKANAKVKDQAAKKVAEKKLHQAGAQSTDISP